MNNKDNDIKAAASKSLAYLHPSDDAFLQTSSFANKYPWKIIFQQIKNEYAA